MRSASKALILFMRYPEPGKVKSRLAAVVGEEKAAATYQKLLRRILGVMADFKRERPEVEIRVYFTPEDKKDAIAQAYGGPWHFIPQAEGHLGERMGEAILSQMRRGFEQVALVGSDLADLCTEDFHEAFDALDCGYAALGPAADGGYYLIGLGRPCPSAFELNAWGTNDVFARTKVLLEDSGLRVHRLKQRKDIDRGEDLGVLDKNPVFDTRLSIIIPTLSDPLDLPPRLLPTLQDQLWPEDEIIVVQGVHGIPGSDPDIWEISPRVRCINSPPGRGAQLNGGARIAKGDIFLFLHDDCAPPLNFCHTVRKIALEPRMSLGCFQLAFSPSSRPMDLIARWANFRTRHLKLPYGDQGLFCRREVFERMGGFKKLYLMEDVDLVQRSRQWGELLICHEEMLASPHTYLRRGILRASMLNHTIMLLYKLGVNDKKLHSIYYNR